MLLGQEWLALAQQRRDGSARTTTKALLAAAVLAVEPRAITSLIHDKNKMKLR